jgi:O-acetylhomoserine/O-acetylserine sulfhydrylase-like pyridoxal-dependent enzyme
MCKFEFELLEAIRLQKKKLMEAAEQLVPHITEEDLLQPNDFPTLENHPFFRYEEGVLEGLLAALTTFRATRKEAVIAS